MPSHRSREEDAPARYDRDHSDEEDFAHSALPATRTSSRGSRRDYDGESDSVEDTDEEDRKLEAELWDEEEVVGAQTGRSKDKKEEGGRQWVMNAIGKSGGSRSQQYASVDRNGHSRSNSARSAGSSSSRTRRMHSIALPIGLGELAGDPNSPFVDDEKRGMKRLSLQSSYNAPPPKRESRGCRIALYVCGALMIVLLVAIIVAVVLMKNREGEEPLITSNSTSSGTLDSMRLSATGTDADGKTLFATLTGSMPSSPNDGTYPSSLNSAGMYPGKASEFDDGKYHTSAQVSAPPSNAQPTDKVSSASSTEATNGLRHPAFSPASSSPTSSPAAKSSAAPSPTSTEEDPWYFFGLGGDDSSTFSGSKASSTSGSTSIDWSTYTGPAFGESPAGPPSPTAAPTDPLHHGGAQPMTVMTWGTQVITVAGGGATAPSPSASTTSPIDWNAVPSTLNWNAAPAATLPPQAWGAPIVLPTPAATPLSYGTANFSMAVQPESWQTREGTATVFLADGHLSACGIAGNDTDYFVALPLALYQSTLVQGSKVESTYCGTQVLVTSLADGASITAWVSGACTSCVGEGSLDLSQATFSALSTPHSDQDADLPIIWGFVAEAQNPTAPFASAAATTVVTS